MVIITAEWRQIVARRRREFGRGPDGWRDGCGFIRSGNRGVAATQMIFSTGEVFVVLFLATEKRAF